ncbi:hypothetical protein [Tenacibaculum sp. M341]|uniref:hypothetical protein n=1 Tax=Tenacibaculum sp. M341 TaxID=2530339 RepID=UPI0010516A90|nr:hypothetical protein [Tenacibaculum sp. M341]TCI93551.1 hypothetical protein EYW44_03850 [Tenacibaculum sp. M341]
MINEIAFHVFIFQKYLLELLSYVCSRMYRINHANMISFVYPIDEKFLRRIFLSINAKNVEVYAL